MSDPTPLPWYSKIDWQGLGRLAVALLGFYGIHVTFTPPAAPPPKPTVESVQRQIDELAKEAKK